MSETSSAPEADTTERWWVKRPWALSLLVFALAFALRLMGIGWGLPNELRNHSLHPDEPVIWIYSQQIDPARLDFAPGFYNYGTLYLTLLRVATDVVEGYSPGIDEADPRAYWLRIGTYHLAGRLISAAAGAGSVLFLFLIMRRWTTLFGALMAAAALGVAPGHLVHSRFQTVDVLAAFFLIVSAWFALRLIPQGREEPPNVMRLALLSGVFAGLSAGTKYTGILALATLAVALYLARPPGWWRAFAAGMGASVVVFVLTTPGVVTNSAKFWEDFRYEMTHTSTGHGLIFEHTSPGFIAHVANLFVGLGIGLTVLGLIGLVWAAFRRQPWALALLGFFVIYYLLIGRAEVKFLRYTFPLYLGLCAGFGWWVAEMHRRRGWRQAFVLLGIASVAGLDGGGLSSGLAYTNDMTSHDPRDQAARRLKRTAEEEGDYVVGFATDPWYYTPPIYPDTGMVRAVRFLDRDAEMRTSRRPMAERYVPRNFEERFDWDVRLLDLAPERVAITSFEYGDPERLTAMPGLRPEVQVIVDRYRAFMERLQQEYVIEFVYGTKPAPIHDMEYVRPVVWVWKRKTD